MNSYAENSSSSSSSSHVALEMNHCPEILLVANKTDLTKSRVVESHRLSAFSHEFNLPLVETSAKLSTNVTLAFEAIATSFLREKIKEEAEGRWKSVVGGPGGLKTFRGGKNLMLDDGDDSNGSNTSAWRKCLGACSIM